MRFSWLIFFPLVAALLFGCSVQKTASTVVGKIAWSGQGVLEREPDVELARQTTPALIKSLEVMAQGNPTDRTVAQLLAKAYGQYAYGFYEEEMLVSQFRDPARYDESRQRASRFYEEGKNYGIGGLKRNHAIAKTLAGPFPEFERAVGKLGRKDVPLMFWTAFSWAGWMNLHRDEPLIIADLPRVGAIIDRVVELDPSYTYGSAYSFQGVINASRPKLLGGNPERAKAAFEAAIAVEPRYLMHRILYAQYYAVQVQDRPLYMHELNELLAADPSALPEQRLANELARRRAKILLEQASRYF